jgi:hypothetical protein
MSNMLILGKLLQRLEMGFRRANEHLVVNAPCNTRKRLLDLLVSLN